VIEMLVELQRRNQTVSGEFMSSNVIRASALMSNYLRGCCVLKMLLEYLYQNQTVHREFRGLGDSYGNKILLELPHHNQVVCEDL